jgi:hypothetical protein
MWLMVVAKNSNAQIFQRKLLFNGAEGFGEFMRARIAEMPPPFKP